MLSKKSGFIISACASIILIFSILKTFLSLDYLRYPEIGLYATLLWLLSILIWIPYILTYRNNTVSKQILKNKEKLLLLGILIFAFSIRLYHINTYAPFLDDWYWLDQVKGILSGSITSPFGFVGDQPSNLPAFFVLPIYILTQKSYLAVRLTGILFSVFNIFLVFLLVRLFFNKTIAFLTIFLMATSIWDIHVSKIPWLNTTINPFLIVGSLYYFYKTITDFSVKNAFLAGIFIGTSINLLYLAAVNILTFMIFSEFLILTQRNKNNTLLKLALIGFFAFLVCSPTFIKIVKYPERAAIARHEQFISNNVQKSKVNGGVTYYLNQTKQTALDFLRFHPDYQGHTYPYWGITLEFFIQILFLLGLVFTVYEYKMFESRLLLLSFFILFIPLVLFDRATSEWREYAFFDFVYFFAGFGLYLVYMSLEVLLTMNRKVQKAAPFLFTFAFLALFYHNYKIYEKNYTYPSLYPYENQCAEVADYLTKHTDKNTTIYFPEDMCRLLAQAKLKDPLTFSLYRNPEELLTLQNFNKNAIVMLTIKQNYNANVLGAYDIQSYLSSSYKKNVLPQSQAIIFQN